MKKSELKQMIDESVKNAFKKKRLFEGDENIENAKNDSYILQEIKSLILKNSKPLDIIESYAKGDKMKMCYHLAYLLCNTLREEGMTFVPKDERNALYQSVMKIAKGADAQSRATAQK